MGPIQRPSTLISLSVKNKGNLTPPPSAFQPLELFLADHKDTDKLRKNQMSFYLMSQGRGTTINLRLPAPVQQNTAQKGQDNHLGNLQRMWTIHSRTKGNGLKLKVSNLEKQSYPTSYRIDCLLNQDGHACFYFLNLLCNWSLSTQITISFSNHTTTVAGFSEQFLWSLTQLSFKCQLALTYLALQPQAGSKLGRVWISFVMQ